MRYLQLFLLIYSLVLTTSSRTSQIRLFQTKNQQRFSQYGYYKNKDKKHSNRMKYDRTQYSTHNKHSKINSRINQFVFNKKAYKFPLKQKLQLYEKKPIIKISYFNQRIPKYFSLSRYKNPFESLQTSTNDINSKNYNCIYYSAGKEDCLNNQKLSQKSVRKEFKPNDVKPITFFQIINKTSEQARIESQKINLQIPLQSTKFNITTQLPTWQLNPEPFYQVPLYKNTKLNQFSKNQSKSKIIQQQLDQTSILSNLSIDEVILAPVTIYSNISDEFALNGSIDSSLLPVPTISVSGDSLRSSLINAQYQTNNPIMFIGQNSLQSRNVVSTQKIRQLLLTSKEINFPLNTNN